jgi:uncharacterized protein with GYD domain
VHRYLFIVNYAPAGMKALLAAGGSSRRAVVEKTAASMGGRLVTFDFAFGTDDAYTVVELPSERAAAALALTVSSSGLTKVRVVVLLTPEDIDAAGQMHPDYTPPGGG